MENDINETVTLCAWQFFGCIA